MVSEVDERKLQARLERHLEKAVWNESKGNGIPQPLENLPISEENMQKLREFDKYNGARQVSWNTRVHYINHIKPVAAILQKPFKSMMKEDMVTFLNEYGRGKKTKTVNNTKIAVKKFFQWFYNMTDDYPEVVKWMKPKPTKTLIEPQMLLTHEEFQELLSVCRNQRDRALVQLMYERGFRPHELTCMKIGDVVTTEYGVRLMVPANTKTGARPLPLVQSAPDLKLWINQHPMKDDPKAPLFIQVNGKGCSALSYDSLRSIFRRLVKRAKLKRHVWMYLIRHTSLTRAARRKMPTATMEKAAGWVHGSRMPAVYVHLSGAETEEDILEAEGVKMTAATKEPPKIQTCPDCNAKMPLDFRLCQVCGFNFALNKRAEDTETLRKEFAEVKCMVRDMAKQLKEAQKGTVLWEKAEKMGFMGIESEGEARESNETDVKSKRKT